MAFNLFGYCFSKRICPKQRINEKLTGGVMLCKELLFLTINSVGECYANRRFSCGLFSFDKRCAFSGGACLLFSFCWCQLH